MGLDPAAVRAGVATGGRPRGAERLARPRRLRPRDCDDRGDRRDADRGRALAPRRPACVRARSARLPGCLRAVPRRVRLGARGGAGRLRGRGVENRARGAGARAGRSVLRGDVPAADHPEQDRRPPPRSDPARRGRRRLALRHPRRVPGRACDGGRVHDHRLDRGGRRARDRAHQLIGDSQEGLAGCRHVTDRKPPRHPQARARLARRRRARARRSGLRRRRLVRVRGRHHHHD